jgi:amidase
MQSTWKETVADKRARVQAAIPREWLVAQSDLPGPEVLDVSTFPDTCGRLVDQELTITNSSVEELLPKLASGEWFAVDVTTAFYKRAIIAHQLVQACLSIYVSGLRGLDQLSHRSFCRNRALQGSRTR